MADADLASKAAKKNKKRKNKKGEGNTYKGVSLDPADLLPVLKEQLAVAKANKDSELANKLRDQLWVITDIVRGVKTDIPEEELQKVIDSLPLCSLQQSAPVSEAPKAEKITGPSESVLVGGGGGGSSNLTTAEKRIRALNKKLTQVEKLKERQANGEKLEDNQLEKIKNVSKITDEIKELEDIMEAARIS
ncbi:unnamed protein product [Owenia fusiformis]|uniref:Uncharacterized protein n=1 Tax=Owenia fusiformis TaxID=6347 RepID=A0A8J1UBZ2_OWEFU|nr:unnamed protein product [Owenia fusiformis]